MPPKKRARTTTPVPKLYQVLEHEHIRNAVLKELPHASLLSLRDVSKIWREPIDAMFLRHVIIEDHPSHHKRRWTAKSPLGPIPQKDWHKKQKLIDQVRYLDLRRTFPPPWLARIQNLKRLRYYLEDTGGHAPLVINLDPFSTLAFGRDSSGEFCLAITDDYDNPGDLVVPVGWHLYDIPRIVLPQTFTFIVLPPLGPEAYLRKDTLVRHLVDRVLALLRWVKVDEQRCRIILCGLETWFHMSSDLVSIHRDDHNQEYSEPNYAVNDFEEFEAKCREDIVGWTWGENQTWKEPHKAATTLLKLVEYVKLDDYRLKVGEEQFKFETEQALST